MARQPKDKGINKVGGIGSLYRQLIPFITPDAVLDGNFWRKVAYNQPIIMDSITSLLMYINGLPYDIQARDANRSDELKSSIEDHKEILDNAQDGEGFLSFLNYWLLDFYMIPFGAGIETLRYSDGRLYKIRALDGATLYPYIKDENFKVVQYVPEVSNDPVFFKKDELVRSYQLPRPELNRRGWQLAQPERIYLAIEMLNRGDKYYANLLLDTPEAGLLDLGDMSAGSAKKWLEEFKTLFTGIDPFKVPVIYEHTKEAKYIPFGRPPTDLMFDNITLRYAQLTTAAFGITIGDIGMKFSTGSLSDSMRDERHSKSTGKAFLKKQIESTMNKILPKELKFVFIDTDDELLVSKGRARSANAVAGRNLIESGAITPPEWRKQLIADGLITIPLTEDVDEEDFEIIKEINGLNDQLELQEQQLELQKDQVEIAAKQAKQNATGTGGQAGLNRKGGQAGFNLNKKRNVRGGKMEAITGKDPVPASSGGQGEVKSTAEDQSKVQNIVSSYFDEVISKINDVRIRRFIKLTLPKLDLYIKSQIENFPVWKSEFINEVYGEVGNFDDREVIAKSIETIISQLERDFEKDGWYNINLDENELRDILSKSYTQGLEDVAYEISQELYENGTISDFAINKPFNLTNELIISSIVERIKWLNEKINNTTRDHVIRLSVKSILDLVETYQNEIMENPDFINNNDFINQVKDHFIDQFYDLMMERSKLISQFEISRAYNFGRLEQIKNYGIDKKYVVHTGLDIPCAECSTNINSGEVDLDYEYITKFDGETSKVAPFHPDCHCIVEFNKQNLESKEYYYGD